MNMAAWAGQANASQLCAHELLSTTKYLHNSVPRGKEQKTGFSFISSTQFTRIYHFFFSIKFKKESFQYNCTSWRILAYHLILNFVIYSDDDLIKSDDDDEDDDLFPSDEAEESESDDGMSFFEEEETKSRFTNYSMTSSVLRRNEGW